METEDFDKLKASGAKLVFMYTKNCIPYDNILYLFKLLNVDLKECLLIDKPCIVDNLIVPQECQWGNFERKSYTKEYVNLINKIKARATFNMPRYEKVYFSRTKIKDCLNRDHGECAIERVFRKKGYKIIYPETISFKEQLSILSQCQFFAATEGSVSHNAIFCKPGTEVAIIRKCDLINQYQLIVNEVADLDVHYIDSHKSINLLDDMKYRGPFFLYLSDNLRKYLGEMEWIWHWPYWLLPSWWYQRNFNRKIVRRMERLFFSLTNKL